MYSATHIASAPDANPHSYRSKSAKFESEGDGQAKSRPLLCVCATTCTKYSIYHHIKHQMHLKTVKHGMCIKYKYNKCSKSHKPYT